eukprot:145397_1
MFHGIMIEPVPDIFSNLMTNVEKYMVDKNNTKRIVLLNAAFSIYPNKTTETFYKMNAPHLKHDTGIKGAWLYQLGSFSKEHILYHLKSYRNMKKLNSDLNYYIDEIEVKLMNSKQIYYVGISNNIFNKYNKSSKKNCKEKNTW